MASGAPSSAVDARDGSRAAAALSPWWAWTLVVLAVACTVLYATEPTPMASLAASAIAGIGGIAAIGIGVRGNRPAFPRPWRRLPAALMIAMVGSVLRASAGAGSALLLVANTIGMVSYALFFLFLLGCCARGMPTPSATRWRTGRSSASLPCSSPGCCWSHPPSPMSS